MKQRKIIIYNFIDQPEIAQILKNNLQQYLYKDYHIVVCQSVKENCSRLLRHQYALILTSPIPLTEDTISLPGKKLWNVPEKIIGSIEYGKSLKNMQCYFSFPIFSYYRLNYMQLANLIIHCE